MHVGDLPARYISFSKRWMATSSDDRGMNYNPPYYFPLLPEGLNPLFRVPWVQARSFLRGLPVFLISDRRVGGQRWFMEMPDVSGAGGARVVFEGA